MKLLNTFFIASLFFLSTKILGQEIQTANGFEIRTGVNLGLWLSQSEKRGLERDSFIIESDFNKIKTIGFDHVRLPIDEVQFWHENGQQQEAAFDLLHKAIDWAKKADLKVIVDLHIIRSHYFLGKSNTLWTDLKEQDKICTLWNQLSAHLKQYPEDFLAYELMNEAVADDPEDWNRLINKMVQSIREIEPKRTIIIGSNKWQSPHTFPFLKIPQNDSNLVLSFHFYEPFGLTHYQTPWNDIKDFTGKVNYPGQVADPSDIDNFREKTGKDINWAMGYYDKEVIRDKIKVAINVSQNLGLPLYCGEYGIYKLTPREPGLRWYLDLVAVFKENNIAYAHWLYKGDFPIVDNDSNPDYEILEIITD